MSAQHPPLTCKQVKQILTDLGFSPRPQKGTSHEQWVKDVPSKRHDVPGKRLKVTVDCPKSPFSPDLISSMAKQADVSKKEFYAALKK